MLITIATPKGEIPKIKPFLLPNEASTQAIDCQFDHGIISPLKNHTAVTTLPNSPQTIFFYEQTYWLNFSDDVDVIESPIAQDEYSRVYWTGEAKPRVASNDIITDGGGDYPAGWYDLGVPAPTSPPLVTNIDDTTGSEPAEGELPAYDDEDRVYVYTYVTRFGEEGSPSDASVSVLIEKPGSTVTVSIPSEVSNTHNITHKRLYRSVTSDGVAEYMLVAELPYAQTSYDDAAATINSAIVETWEYSVPDANMQGLTMMANGIAAGFFGNELMFSEAYLPYAWPEEYRLTTEHEIVAIAAIETSLIVLTKGYPYFISGVTPSSMTSQKIPVAQACISKHSVVVMNGSVMYASPDGLIAISYSGQPTPLTEAIITREQWDDYSPATIKADAIEGKYIGQYTGGCFIFDPVSGSFTQLSDTWDCSFLNLEDDKLYICQGADVSSYGTGSSKSMTWRSKEFMLPKDTWVSCCRVQAITPGNLTVTFYVDGVLLYTVSAGELTDDGFRLPAARGNKWQIKVVGQSEVEKILLATSLPELM